MELLFRCGQIQDLAIDLEILADELKLKKIESSDDALKVLQLSDVIRAERPMIADNSVDCVVSNCVLNLVKPADRKKLFAEIFRVLKPGGKAAISDIVADEDIPLDLQANEELWSGCISGAWREDQFIDEFQQANFFGMTIDKRQSEAWQTVAGIEFRSVTVLAYKPFADACLERNQAVIYRGPFAKIVDDEGKTYPRGVRMAVCDRTFRFLQQGPYAEHFIPVEPLQEVPLDSAAEIDCTVSRVRSAKETKGQEYKMTIQINDDCCGGTSCC